MWSEGFEESDATVDFRLLNSSGSRAATAQGARKPPQEEKVKLPPDAGLVAGVKVGAPRRPWHCGTALPRAADRVGPSRQQPAGHRRQAPHAQGIQQGKGPRRDVREQPLPGLYRLRAPRARLYSKYRGKGVEVVAVNPNNPKARPVERARVTPT